MRYPLGKLATIVILAAVSLRAAAWTDQVNRGNLLLEQGLYSQAAEEFQASLPQANGQVQQGVSLFSLGLADQLLGDFAASERGYKEALSLFRAERDYENLALSLSGLGQVYKAEHRLDDALETERNALLALRRIGKEKTGDAAFVLGVTGAILGELDRWKDAQRSLEEAQAILKNTLGPDTPEFATNLDRLGEIALARKRFDEAEGLLTQALGFRQSHLGLDHPSIASSLLLLSSVHRAQRRYVEADGECRRALEILRHSLPDNHPKLIKGSIELATVAHDSGNITAAVGILAETMGRMGSHPANITEEYVELVSLYAKYLDDAGEKQKAREFRTEARDMEQQVSRTALARSTVDVSEMDAGGFR
jgi:tetratricopeptide (TPR) repeat protein